MPLASIMRTWLFRASVTYTSPLGAKLRPRGLLNWESVADTLSVPGPPCRKLTVFPPMVVMVPAGPVGLGTAWADCMAARPVPPAMSAATSAATPRGGGSRRFEDGYDILCVLQGARGCQGGTSGYCKGAPRGLRRCGRWHQWGRPRAPGHVRWSGNGIREVAPRFLLLQRDLEVPGRRRPVLTCPSMIKVRVVGDISEADLAEVRDLLEAVGRFDDHPALGEHKWLALV